MKAAACSWRDMRKVRHILANAKRLKGEAEALMRCADKATVSGWRRAIEVMEAIGSDIRTVHLRPSHAEVIARSAPRESWPRWVARCEAEQLTVPELRGAMLAERAATAAAVAEATTPDGKFRTIVVDPPWDYGNKSGRQRADYADKMMTLDQIAAFDVARWMPEDGGCHLYLWVTDAYAWDAGPIIRAWGFTPKVSLVWAKDRMGMGNYYRHQHELCVFAVRGSLRLKRSDVATVHEWKATGHSWKPDGFYVLVESCSPGPYLDVFARVKRAGWSVFGDEVADSGVYQTRFDGRNESPVVRG